VPDIATAAGYADIIAEQISSEIGWHRWAFCQQLADHLGYTDLFSQMIAEGVRDIRPS
jgi:hypothetical protein